MLSRQAGRAELGGEGTEWGWHQPSQPNPILYVRPCSWTWGVSSLHQQNCQQKEAKRPTACSVPLSQGKGTNISFSCGAFCGYLAAVGCSWSHLATTAPVVARQLRIGLPVPDRLRITELTVLLGKCA